MRRIHMLIGGALLMLVNSAAFAQTPADTAMQLNAFDQEFVSKAGASGMTEVKLAEIALERGTDAIRSIAERMRTDHTAANEQLMMLTRMKDLSLPAAVPAEDQQTIDRLSALKGEEFDRAYIDQLKTSHQKSLQLFVDEMKNGGDIDLLAFAARTAPVIIQHTALLHGGSTAGMTRDTGAPGPDRPPAATPGY